MKPARHLAEPRPLVVLPHAIKRARQRFQLADSTDRMIERYLCAEVRAALEAGRIKDHKPKAWRLYGERSCVLDHVIDRFVWDVAEERAWILRRESARDVIVTALSRPGPRWARRGEAWLERGGSDGCAQT